MDHTATSLGEHPTQLRRHARVRVSAPFPCSFAHVGLKKWLTVERGGLGVVYDVSTKGARVMTESVITPGDRIAINLRFPNQVSSTFVELATVRWGQAHTYGVEFDDLSPIAAMRLRKYLHRITNTHATSSL